MLNTVTKAFYFFIVTYCYNLQAAYNPDAVFWATVQAGQNSQYARDVRINSAVVNDQISL